MLRGETLVLTDNDHREEHADLGHHLIGLLHERAKDRRRGGEKERRGNERKRRGHRETTREVGVLASLVEFM